MKINNFLLANMIVSDIKNTGDLSFKTTLHLCDRDEDKLDRLKDRLIDLEAEAIKLRAELKDVNSDGAEKCTSKIKAIKLALIRVEEVRWTFHNFK